MNLGTDYMSQRHGDYYGPYTYEQKEEDAAASATNSSTYAYTWENMLTFSKTFAEVHSLNVTGLYSLQKTTAESYYLETSGVPIESMTFLNLDASTDVTGYSSSSTERGIESYMGRINYNFKNKYLVTVAARLDGSSVFDDGKKFGLFPSFALGWRISEERFMQNTPIISYLKLRASYGKIGNANISPYSTLGSLSRVNYTWGDDGDYGYTTSDASNYELSWENTATVNLGLDFGFFDSRIQGSLEVYKQYTSDLLLERQYPLSSGTSNASTENIGKTQNKGIELTLNTVNIVSGNGFKWTTDWRFFANREEIVDLYGDKTDDVGNSWFIGEPLTVYYDYKKIGIWQSDEATEAAEYGSEPGDIKIQDNSGSDDDGNTTDGADGQITTADKVVLGSDVPDWSCGITNKFEYRNFDFSFFFFIRHGGMLYNNAIADGQGRQNNLNLDYWTETNPTNEFRRPQVGQSQTYDDSFKYCDGSFIKLRNVQLGYNLPKSLVSRVNLSSLRVYASAQNILTFSKFFDDYGIDPELGAEASSGSEQLPEYTSGNTPSTKVFLVGLNVKF
jgi:TonB-linked SusC/RagA family outer membrane protein